MDSSTGRLIALAKNLRGEDELPEGFDLLPGNLEMTARLKLSGQPAAQVNLRSNTPLANWARKKRLEKIAAKSRRRNRK